MDELDSDFLIELRYATDNNFTGQVIYDSDLCYIYEKTAKLLIAAKEIFKSRGYKVKVWDAYRPHRAQKFLWEVYPNEDFVARAPSLDKDYQPRPSHMNGMCVDITLIDEKGQEVPMPTAFDEFTEDANLAKTGASKERVANALLLQEVMMEVGFKPIKSEWWHFYDGVSAPVAYSDLYL